MENGNTMSRRDAVRAAVLLSSSLGPYEAEAAAKSGWIDAHVHVWTPETVTYPLAEGFKPEQMQPKSFTPEELLKHARPCGVGRIVLIQMSYYRYDNSYMIDTMRRFPGVFSGVGIVNEEAAKPQDEMRRLAKQGVRGFRIYPGGSGVSHWLDGPGMNAMWKCGGEDRLAMCPLVNPDALPSIDRMCGKYPDTPVVLDHFARIGATGEIREEDVKQLANLARHKHTHVKISAFYALGKKQYPYTDLIPMIRRLYDTYGAQRLMWATDCPFQVEKGHTYAGSIELVRDRLEFTSPQDREWLLKKTAERVFF